jgi:predicted RNase H-like nuclease (RuvC/YqgF family)
MPAERTDAELQAKVEAMALEIARYEGELLARDWRIAELEQSLAIAESAAMLSTPPPPPEKTQAARPAGAENKRITELEAEIDTLRRALAQEHEEKKRVESGQGVDELRAALAEKMALIEQLSQRAAGAEAR